MKITDKQKAQLIEACRVAYSDTEVNKIDQELERIEKAKLDAVEKRENKVE